LKKHGCDLGVSAILEFDGSENVSKQTALITSDLRAYCDGIAVIGCTEGVVKVFK